MLSLQEAALSWFPISHRHDPVKESGPATLLSRQENVREAHYLSFGP